MRAFYSFLLPFKTNPPIERMNNDENRPGKNIIICLDGTGNQYGEKLSNVVKLFRMIEREAGKQVAYYDPGVGTMGDPTHKSVVGRKVNKVLGLAFGRGLMTNLIEAYTYLIEHYEDGDKVFIFGFSRGAYTARVLAAFIKDCGLFEKGAENLLPYAMALFLEQAPRDEKKAREFYRILSGFRSTFGRLLNRKGDPRYPERTGKVEPSHQLRIHFLGLFDTVKSYGWIKNPVVLRNEVKNDSVLNVRHAISIDERRSFFHQMHWKASKPNRQTCKEVWFAGSHSDVGGSYPESESGLAEVALEWMVHEACSFGLEVDYNRYGHTMQKQQDEHSKWVSRIVEEADIGKYTGPNAMAEAHESLGGGWKLAQILPKKLEPWEEHKGQRTIKSEQQRLEGGEDHNLLMVHQSVFDRIDGGIGYRPKNLLSSLGGDFDNLSEVSIEQTKHADEVLGKKT